MAITKHLDDQIDRLEKLQKDNANLYVQGSSIERVLAIEQALATAYLAREIARK
jgi:hypothetical protein